MKKKILMLILFTAAFFLPVFARDIYVAKNGSNSNPGTFSQPYLTIARAAQVAVAGDVVYIRGGTYEESLRPAHSGKSGKPIIFQAYPQEKVIITAMQALKNWSKDSGQVYRTIVGWDLGQLNFVISEKAVLDLARWPNNSDGLPFTKNTLRNTGGSGPNVEYNAHLSYGPGIPNLDWSKGGSVYFYGDKPGGGWIAWKAFIKYNTHNKVTFDLDKKPSWIRTAHAPADKGEFFLEGVRGVLDYQNEWYLDSNTKVLYVQLPGGKAPVDGQVKMRKRQLTIDLYNRHHIQIKNLAVFGGSINITGNASYNKLYGVSSFYGNYHRGVIKGFQSHSQSIHVKGSNNSIEKCEIAFGSGSGIYDNGSKNKILNCYVHDFNWIGSYDAVLMSRNGSNSIVKNNTFSRGGRDVIQANHKGSEFAYNDVSYCSLIADDCALFYSVGGPHNIKIHHNWFHDAYSSGKKKKAAGIYLDTSPVGFLVHHNVVWNTEWTNIQINWNGKDISIFNNTLVNGSAVMGAWHKPGTHFTNVKVWNNLSDDKKWEPQSNKQNNITYNSDPFVHKSAGNFYLKKNAYPIDRGREISGITEGYKGAYPDVGAYEYGASHWKAGINWKPENAASGYGLYGLLGELNAASIPGKIEAENFTTQSGIQVEITTDQGGGQNVGYIENNDYIEFNVNIKQSGHYQIAFRSASATNGGSIDLLVNGHKKGTVSIPGTSGWQNWKTVVTNVWLEAGSKKLRLSFKGGSGYLFNLNWLDFKLK